MSNNIVRTNPSTLPDSGAMGYSQITTINPGRMSYISGQVAWRPNGEAVPNDLLAQVKIVSANIKAALEAIDATPHEVVLARIYVIDLTPERMESVMPTLMATFEGAQPCITGVGVASLAAPDLQIEMELVVRHSD